MIPQFYCLMDLWTFKCFKYYIKVTKLEFGHFIRPVCGFTVVSIFSNTKVVFYKYYQNIIFGNITEYPTYIHMWSGLQHQPCPHKFDIH